MLHKEFDPAEPTRLPLVLTTSYDIGRIRYKHPCLIQVWQLDFGTTIFLIIAGIINHSISYLPPSSIDDVELLPLYEKLFGLRVIPSPRIDGLLEIEHIPMVSWDYQFSPEANLLLVQCSPSGMEFAYQNPELHHEALAIKLENEVSFTYVNMHRME